jgi:hypothetical protein
MITKKSIIMVIVALAINSVYAQVIADVQFIEYVNSFEKERIDKIINLGVIIQKKNPMTKEEALNFVYHTKDTTKLYCYTKIVQQDPQERWLGIDTSLYLPSKCLRVDMGDYFFIGHTSYTCQDPNKMFYVYLHLLIVDKNYNITDSMLVCNDNGYDYDITGLLNPQNGKVVTATYANGRYIHVYKVNSGTLKFEIIQQIEVNDKKISFDYLENGIRKLGLKDFSID